MTVISEKVTKEIDLSEEQEEAISHCVNRENRVYAVTGLAGTGKTTILKQVHNELKTSMPASSIVLCAPTGRAAKRIHEATGISALTIHRLLEFPRPSADGVEIVDTDGVIDLGDPGPRRNRDRPIVQKVVLVDEASMIGPVLDRQLRDALPKGAVIRYFGDASQLPPVETGEAPFRKLCKSEDSITLTRNYRSDDEIIGNSLLILKGRMPQRNSRFEVIYTENPVATLLEYCDKRFVEANNQVIMTMRKGNYGTSRANPSLQIKFNPRGDFLQLDRFEEKDPQLVVKGNDKFLWTKNDYNFDLYNGEIGTIDDIDTESGDVVIGLVDRGHIRIPARAKAYGAYGPYHYDPRKQIDLGYAITTHKAQGSEFDTVVYVMSSKGQGGMWMCSRNNLYTGITRARKNVVIITDRKAMHWSLRKVV